MKKSVRLVQLINSTAERHVALVREPELVILKEVTSIYELARLAITENKSLIQLIKEKLSKNTINYDEVYGGSSDYTLLPSFDHPSNSSACILSGTGLTHKNSALNRQVMHQGAENVTLTDSILMYQWGLDGGHPSAGAIGVQPEWFYKGTASNLRAHGQKLEVTSFSDDGGEEPEVAGVYIIDQEGQPFRIGFTCANEFSDHIMEKKNYLYLAPSKLRSCSIGPELLISNDFSHISGVVSIKREDETIWSKKINTGEKNMAHSLANLEHHHFKYPCHRVAGQAHIHFFGADSFSFGDKLQLQDGDEMIIHWEDMGRPLKNILTITKPSQAPVQVKSLF